MSRVIGVTGGIASGKSLACRELNLPLVDADLVAREVVAPGSAGLSELVKSFGEGILQADGSLDRMALRGLISQDEAARQKLNAITHPLILAEMRRRIDGLADIPLVLASAALMIETGSFSRYDAVLLVTAPFELRLARLQARDGIRKEDALALMAKQMSDEEKRTRLKGQDLPWAEVVNDADVQTLKVRSQAALQKLAHQVGT